MLREEVWIGLLGTLEVHHAPGIPITQRSVRITAAKLRQVLAMLAANANTMISTEQLIDELWPEDPPSSAKTIVQTYVYQLRKLFCKALRSPDATTLLTTHNRGYMLTVARDNVDIFQFQQLVRGGRTALRDGQPARAADMLRESLALWRGPVLADVASGPSLRGLSVYLEEQRVEAVSLRIEADLSNNRHREVVGELRRLIANHPLHEFFYILLMQALHGSGRRGEAITVYHQLRRILDQDLALSPSREAERVLKEILISA